MSVTPMMAQYLEIKEAHRDALLFYRMGDFYELFFDDAVAAAEALDIALTKRGKHLGDDIPMCGVPVHSAEGYLLTLIRKGFRVAVCEQLEDPSEAKKRGSKAVVKRGVVRLVTPGTLTEEALLEARQNNFLASVSEVRGDAAISWVDISTGELRVMSCAPARFSPELSRLRPREVLVSESHGAILEDAMVDTETSVTPLSPVSFDSQSARRRLCSLYGVESLDGFGSFSRAEIAALGAIVDYLDLTQKGKLPLLRPPVQESASACMQIDAATRRNLELTRSLSGTRDGSLLHAVDRTVTAAGGRLLERRVSSPSRDLETIHGRLGATAWFVENQEVSNAVRDHLRRCPDVQRGLSRLSIGRGGPRDLASIRAALTQLPEISSAFGDHAPQNFREWVRSFEGFDELLRLLKDALVKEPPLLIRDGGFVAAGYSEPLDEVRNMRDEGRGIIARYQKVYAEEADIASLKIKHNNVLGYFIETTATHAEKMLSEPLSQKFIHRQTTASAVRFTTTELSEIETKILNSGARALELEKSVFEDLLSKVLSYSVQLGAAASAIAELDVVAAFATIARDEDWCRPEMNGGRSFRVNGGRHPVVERALKRDGGVPFTPNDCDLAAREGAAIWLLTGPNMAGKSTFLRQNALIALLAQAGSFVPARSAEIGVVSQLFSRVGASDDLARGRSTFMVEMVETAAILNQADDRALVILDEIGRGTATYDGLSIAWATLEHLHEANKCRALFATHYHELTQLSDKLEGVENATVAVKEWEGDVIFLHEVRKGAADRSYGVQVARLAGLPQAVIDRARVVLDALEKGERNGVLSQRTLAEELPLFSIVAKTPENVSNKNLEIERRLAEILPDETSPREALDLLYELKGLVRTSLTS
ncbi:MAG: DNA mismatch repair protein MutS [Silicimonas sp.]|nr:DNA mismatch repair protein MutS [Silicimonas sp.]